MQRMARKAVSEETLRAVDEHVRTMVLDMADRDLLRPPPSYRSTRGNESLADSLARKGIWEATLTTLDQLSPATKDALLDRAGGSEALSVPCAR